MRSHAQRLYSVCRSGSYRFPARRLRAGCGFAAPGCIALLLAFSPIIRARSSIIAARAIVKGEGSQAPPAIAALDNSPFALLSAKYRARNKYGTIPRPYPKKEGVKMEGVKTYAVELCDLIAAAAELDLQVCDLIAAAEEISANAQSVSDALATYLATAKAAAPAAK